MKFGELMVDAGITSFMVPLCRIKESGGGLQLLGMQGTGILLGTFIRNTADAQGVLSTCLDANEAISLMTTARGSLAILLFSPSDQSVFLLNDPLGGAPIYFYHGENCEALSSDLGSLVSAVKIRSERLTAAPKYFAAGILTGTHSYGSSSPFKEIEVLRRGIGVKIDAFGNISRFQTLSGEKLYFSSESYERGFEESQIDICTNVHIAAQADFHSKNAHLTAGFDSRLVLAAIVHLDLQDCFVFSCIENSSDWEVAKSVAGALNLNFSGSDGSPKGTGYALNYLESITRTARRSAGSIVAGIDP